MKNVAIPCENRILNDTDLPLINVAIRAEFFSLNYYSESSWLSWLLEVKLLLLK